MNGSVACMELMQRMTTEQKVAQLIMPAFRQYTDSQGKRQDVVRMYPEMERILSSYPFAGVMLFAMNLKTTRAGVELVRAIRACSAKCPDLPGLLLAADQEGGSVTRLGQGTQTPGNMALGAGGDPVLTRNCAAVIGRELKAAGLDANAGPVLDVNDNPLNPVIGIRSFSDNPELVATMGRAYLEGLGESGVIGMLKHFPGHGNTAVDSHTGLPCVEKTLEELERVELKPFAACVRAGAEMVMTAHIQFPQVEKQTYRSKKTGEPVVLPATLSRAVLGGLLRDRLGFEGVVITDSMGMDAISSHFDPLDAAKLAIEAGADILLMPVDTAAPGGVKRLEDYVRRVAKAVEQGVIRPKAVEQAVLRVLALKERHGLLRAGEIPAPDVSVAQKQIGSAENRKTEWEAALRAVTLVRDKGVLPLSPREQTVVSVPFESEVHSVRFALDRLDLLGDGPEIVCPAEKGDWEKMLRAPVLLAVSACYRVNSLLTDGAKDPYVERLRQILADRKKQGKVSVVISAQLPYDLALYPDADALLAAYCAKGMSEDPRFASNGVVQYNANLPAAVFSVFRSPCRFSGRLPLSVPSLESLSGGSRENLFDRGFGLDGESTCKRKNQTGR
ncbi:MAG: hypothetical protein IJU20_02000 [Clostridia bacterium]|nr:hypothetical protein [Clostridia bacterium]